MAAGESRKKGKSGTHKYGRNVKKCQSYAANGKRTKNKKRRWEGLILHWLEIGTPGMLKQAAFLQGKLDRREFGRQGWTMPVRRG